MNRNEGQWTQQELEFPAHRGIRLTKQNIDPNLGMHWSSSEDTAQKFSGAQSKNLDFNKVTPKVLHGLIPMSSVETDTKRLASGQVLLNQPGVEREISTKWNAPVKITGASTFKKTKGGGVRQRTRSYNPPREMKA